MRGQDRLRFAVAPAALLQLWERGAGKALEDSEHGGQEAPPLSGQEDGTGAVLGITADQISFSVTLMSPTDASWHQTPGLV